VAIIGIIAAIAPSFVDHLMDQIYKKSNVIIRILPYESDSDQRARVIVANTGTISSNNISLSIFAPKDILNVTDNSFISRFNPIVEGNLYELKIPKLVPGSGAALEFDLLINATKTSLLYNYTGATMYDEGSGNVIVEYSRDPMLQKLYELFGDPFYFFLIIFYISNILPAYYLLRRKNKLIKKKQISNILNELRFIRDTLHNNVFYADQIDNKWDSIKDKYFKKELISPKDYLRLDSFYSFLNKRNLDVSHNKTNEILIQSENEEIQTKIKDLLSQIDWNRYYS
jgi:hypothetical protein